MMSHVIVRAFSRLAMVSILTAVIAFGQPKPSFEVATIKPSPPFDLTKMAVAMQNGQAPRLGAHVNAGRAEYNYLILRDLIVLAYGVKPYQVTGPDWITGTRFDIVAKIPAGAAKDDVPKMLQALLEERFKLTLHKSSAEHPVLALVVAKGGPKLKESTETPKPIDETAELKPGEMKIDGPDGPIRTIIGNNDSAALDMGAKGKVSYKMTANQSMHVEASMVTMSGFADILTLFSQRAGPDGRQIVDMTGLKGYYDVAIDFSLAEFLNMVRTTGMNAPGGAGAKSPGADGPADLASDPGGGAASVIEAVRALGLRLESRKTMVEQLIIDHAEKTPTEN
jgi:uncharacterized protein (TIGR03435 family)